VALAFRNTPAGFVPFEIQPTDASAGSSMQGKEVWEGFTPNEGPSGGVVRGVDLEGDGDLDLYNRRSLTVMRNQGGGRFVSETLPILFRGATLESFEIMDFELERTGRFLTARLLATTADPGGGACGIERRDCGHLLVGVATQEVNGPWSQLRATFAPVQGEPFQLAAGDVDGDGLGDLVATVRPLLVPDPDLEPEGYAAYLFLGTQDGGLSVPRPLAISHPFPGSTPLWLGASLFDADDDGLNDLVFGLLSSDQLWVVQNNSE
jgi:hypothetical protein